MVIIEPAARTALIASACAFAMDAIRAARPLNAEARHELTMIRCYLLRNGYDLQARAPHEGVTMTDDMEVAVEAMELCKLVIMQTDYSMKLMDDARNYMLWKEREDAQRDEAEARAKEAEAEEEVTRMREVEEEEDVDGQGVDLEDQD
ncbi:uncharacterized protein LAJ45_03711 [Morchella importuna]|uniref:uncharacterized protein n=1 Tax=Morchella importuna TaxID=1174673 RepID=UPI001E8D039A|nr:uncharacterized protein LAJ45_03711 [Morchella importuna]KAH8152284.1 hypothetical protein LAJ45_03711 [Morchella importuna]